MATGKQPPKTSRSRHQPRFFLVSAALGLLMILAGLYLTYQQTILSFTTPPPPQQIVNVRESPPVRIRIASGSIDLPIEVGWIRNGKWDISPKNASHLATSAHPRESGNIVVYGHNKEAIFGKLRQVKQGDLIELETAEGESHDYRVTEISQVTPKQIEVVLPTDYEVLTVYTCTGFLDSRRLIIKAIPY